MFGKKQKSNLTDIQNENTQYLHSPTNKFIFYNSEEQFQQKIEFYSILSSNPSKKLLTIIDTNSSLEYLQIKMAETFEQFPEYKNLDGLKAINIYKTKIDQTKIVLPVASNSDVNQYITNGDFVYCDLISDEYWLQCYVHMKTKHDNLYNAFKFQMKVKKKMPFHSVKSFIMKIALDQWSDFIIKYNKKERTIPKTYYVYQVLYSSNDNKNLKDNSTVNDLFNFNSEIKCNITFISFEDHLFLLLQKSDLIPRYNTQLKWIEFKELTFYLFERSSKYKTEYKWIRMFIRKMLSLHKNTNWYVYINLRNKSSLQLIPNEGADDSLMLTQLNKRHHNTYHVNNNKNMVDSNIIKGRNKLLVVIANKNNSSYYLDDLLKYFKNSKNSRNLFHKQISGDKVNYIDTNSTDQLFSYKSDTKDNILLADSYSNEVVSVGEQSKTFMNKQNLLQSQLHQNSSSKNVSSENNFSLSSKEQKSKSVNKKNLEKSFYSTNLETPLVVKRQNQINKTVRFQQKSIASILKQFRLGSNYCNLCLEFMKNCTKTMFMRSLKPMYEITCEYGYLERLILPETRSFEEIEHEDLVNDEMMSESTEFIESFANKYYMFKQLQRQIIVFIVGFLIVTILWTLLIFKYANKLVK